MQLPSEVDVQAPSTSHAHQLGESEDSEESLDEDDLLHSDLSVFEMSGSETESDL